MTMLQDYGTLQIGCIGSSSGTLGLALLSPKIRKS